MILEALFLAFTLGKESSERSAAARQVEEWKNDTELQRKEFFAYKKRWGEDKFLLFGHIGNTDGRVYRWEDAEKQLDLLEEGYFPYPFGMEMPITKETLRKYSLEKSKFKTVPVSDGMAFLYIKLSDVEKYITYRNSKGRYYKCSICEEIPAEIRNWFYEGKVTIGVPYGHGLGGSMPCQVMTFQEAREFMKARMEELFKEQRY